MPTPESPSVEVPNPPIIDSYEFGQTTQESPLAPAGNIEESYPALIGLRRAILATALAWNDITQDEVEHRDKSFSSSANMAARESSLQPHKLEGVTRPVTFVERYVDRRRRKQTRHMRETRYEQMRSSYYGNSVNFINADDVKKGSERLTVRDPEYLSAVRAAKIPKREKRAYTKAARQHHHHGEHVSELKMVLDRAADSETKPSERRNTKLQRLERRNEKVERKLIELRRLAPVAEAAHKQKRLERKEKITHAVKSTGRPTRKVASNTIHDVRKTKENRGAKRAAKEAKRISKLPPPPDPTI